MEERDGQGWKKMAEALREAGKEGGDAGCTKGWEINRRIHT